ncbi:MULTISPECIES: hypothetical protein [Avibacterium]|uniref:hypothetical protein n=1 Tax=Avibacterium TaxID=292486 RepID=UPI0021F6E1A5|nr:hypothetical protein [Avibacterium paragallinarum]UXN35684.1 hypothetical protein N8E86_05680 [Avibacterium paragallinarum]
MKFTKTFLITTLFSLSVIGFSQAAEQGYNPYRNTQNSQYPTPNSTVTDASLTPEQMQQSLQERQNYIDDIYGQYARQRVAQAEQTAIATNMSESSRIAAMITADPFRESSQDRNRNRAMEAKRRLAARLGDEQKRFEEVHARQLETIGVPREEINKRRQDQEDLRHAKVEKRIANFEAWEKNPQSVLLDFELQSDINNRSLEEVRAKYVDNPELLSYIENKK